MFSPRLALIYFNLWKKTLITTTTIKIIYLQSVLQKTKTKIIMVFILFVYVHSQCSFHIYVRKLLIDGTMKKTAAREITTTIREKNLWKARRPKVFVCTFIFNDSVVIQKRQDLRPPVATVPMHWCRKTRAVAISPFDSRTKNETYRRCTFSA